MYFQFERRTNSHEKLISYVELLFHTAATAAATIKTIFMLVVPFVVMRKKNCLDSYIWPSGSKKRNGFAKRIGNISFTCCAFTSHIHCIKCLDFWFTTQKQMWRECTLKWASKTRSMWMSFRSFFPLQSADFIDGFSSYNRFKKKSFKFQKYLWFRKKNIWYSTLNWK